MLTIVRCTEHVIKSKAAKWFECNHCDQYNAVSMTFRFVWIQFKFHASPKLIQKCNPVSASVIRSCPDLHIELTVYCIFIAAVGSTVRNNWWSTKKIHSSLLLLWIVFLFEEAFRILTFCDRPLYLCQLGVNVITSQLMLRWIHLTKEFFCFQVDLPRLL